MSDSVNVLNKVTALDTAPAFLPFTGVRLWRDDEVYYFAGNETGRVLEADFPWATQPIAESVLASINGFMYKPFSAQNALLNPAAEMGDGVTVGGVYSVLAAVDTNFNAMCASHISAPSDEEIDHEYHYASPEKRLERRVSKMNSELRVMSDEISSIVESSNATYRQNTVPKNPRKGDMWYVSSNDDVVDGGNTYHHGKWYYYDGNGWVETTDIGITENSAEIKQTADSITATVTEQTERIDGLEKTVAENKSSIEQTAESITATVEEHTEKISGLEETVTDNYSEFKQTSEGFTTTVTEQTTRIDGLEETVASNYSEFTQTAEGFSQRISNAEGDIVEISSSVNGISQRVTSAEGDIAEINQNSEELSQRVTNAEGTSTEALQTANGFSQRITDAEGNISTIEHTLDGVVYTTANGTTEIDGSHITTGTIDAERIDTDNLIVNNGNITSLDVGKLRVDGSPITADNPWDTGYHRNVWVAQASDGSGGNITIDGTDVGYARLSPTGVELTYGVGSGGSMTITASWKEIIESALGGGYATAVFG